MNELEFKLSPVESSLDCLICCECLSVLPLPQEIKQGPHRVQQHLMVRNSCTVLQSATEAVLEDRTQSFPTLDKAVLDVSWHVAEPMSSSLGPKETPPSNIPQLPH